MKIARSLKARAEGARIHLATGRTHRPHWGRSGCRLDVERERDVEFNAERALVIFATIPSADDQCTTGRFSIAPLSKRHAERYRAITRKVADLVTANADINGVGVIRIVRLRHENSGAFMTRAVFGTAPRRWLQVRFGSAILPRPRIDRFRRPWQLRRPLAEPAAKIHLREKTWPQRKSSGPRPQRR
jgi:hypothetical protein